MAATQRSRFSRYECTVDPCPRKKPKYFTQHIDSNIWLTDDDLKAARQCFGVASSIQDSVRVMCNFHWERFQQFTQQEGGDHFIAHSHNTGAPEKPKQRKEQTCTKCGQPRKGHICTGQPKRDREGRYSDGPQSRSRTSSAAAAAPPVLSAKESRSLLQQLKPTLGKRKAVAELPFPFSKQTAAKSLFSLATDELLKRAVRHDASILTRFFMRAVPFKQVGPYEVPPGPYNPVPPPPQPRAPSPSPPTVRRRFVSESLSLPFERYPIEEELREMHRRHREELGEEPVDQ